MTGAERQACGGDMSGGDMSGLLSEISQENERKLAQMSLADIREEQKQIENMFGMLLYFPLLF